MQTTRVRGMAIAAWAVFLAAAAPAAVHAQAPAMIATALPAADVRSIRVVVEAQLAAFAADDATAAFSHAAPTIRSMFGTPERFMAMVRAGYPVVYRPSGVLFLAPVQVQGQIVQGVQMTDSGGALWLAVYSLERQGDGSWKISGCNVQPQSGRMT